LSEVLLAQAVAAGAGETLLSFRGHQFVDMLRDNGDLALELFTRVPECKFPCVFRSNRTGFEIPFGFHPSFSG
jgi:hypothetical protein